MRSARELAAGRARIGGALRIPVASDPSRGSSPRDASGQPAPCRPQCREVTNISTRGSGRPTAPASRGLWSIYGGNSRWRIRPIC